MGRRRGFFAQISHGIVEAQRLERRRQRELLAQGRHAERMQAALSREGEREIAQVEAETFSNKIALLTTMHRDAGPTMDWRALGAAPRPSLPTTNTTALDEARAAVETYQPGLLGKAVWPCTQRADHTAARAR